jgi:hypothetical protein
VSDVDERKALERLHRATRNLTSGARFGASQPPPAEVEATAPGQSQPPETPPQGPEKPPGQS